MAVCKLLFTKESVSDLKFGIFFAEFTNLNYLYIFVT